MKIGSNKMNETEIIPKQLTKEDNTLNVEMTENEIAFIKHFLTKNNPKKIVEIGVSAGGNTVNLLNWKNKEAQLYSIDLAKQWYRDNKKLSGFMADDVKNKNNWKIYRGYDYLDVYKEIGNDIDFIIIDTVHAMPGEFLTFIATLPQLKDGCMVILHDIHLNNVKFSNNTFDNYSVAAYCTGLLFGGVSSEKKWTLKLDNDDISNIGGFIIDDTTRKNIKDIFHILCASWYTYPSELNLNEYSEYIKENYPVECYKLFNKCIKSQKKFFNYKPENTARIDIINEKNNNNQIEILEYSDNIKISTPSWFNKGKGVGKVFETNDKSFNLKFKCIENGELKIKLRGPDIRDRNGYRIPIYITYNSFKINKKDILKGNVTVWHDASFSFIKNVKDGEIIELHSEWNPAK